MRGCVAVTGATGFIGRHLIDTLKDAGFGLRALSRRAAGHGLPQEVEVISGSLDDEAELIRLVERADAVVHCAGLIKGEDSQVLERVNVTGTIHLARLCAQQPKPPRFIFLSSLAARHPELSVYATTANYFFEEHHRELAARVDAWCRDTLAPLADAADFHTDIDGSCKTILRLLGEAGYTQ